ncbi:hypothetical protein ACOSP7_013711 [Xanthoceras sorbifolium]
MFSSEPWEQCKWATSTKGKAAFATVMSMSFWNGVTTCLKVFAPLVKVLRLVDGDKKPAMGFVYGELVQAKEEIKVALNNIFMKMTSFRMKRKMMLMWNMNPMENFRILYYHFIIFSCFHNLE